MNARIRSQYLRDFIKEIQYNNRNPRDTKAIKLLDDISTNPERVLSKGTVLFRCRIIKDESQIGKEKGFYGYGAKDSFIPPSKLTKDFRANYRYIPYLYCANHPYIALIEVRPRLGACVSVATIQVNELIRVLDFTVQKTPSKMTDAKKNLFADLSTLYSKPVTDDDDVLDYIPTQYIAEYAKNLGYDGIAYRSSLTPELENQDTILYQNLDRYNVVVFNYKKCTPVKSNVVEVTLNSIECSQTDEDMSRLDIHAPVLDMGF